MTADILDYTFGPTLKTGQTTDYTPAGATSQDDGVLQRGINKSKEDAQYVVLTTGQYSGTTNITLKGNTESKSNECVYDKSTNLMWSRTLSGAVFGNSGTDDLEWDTPPGGSSDSGIFEYCDEANAQNLAGYNDWRLANIDELATLSIRENGSSFPNATAFPVWSSIEVWSSTTRADSTNDAVDFGFGTGRSFDQNKGAKAKCLLVRLGIEN